MKINESPGSENRSQLFDWTSRDNNHSLTRYCNEERPGNPPGNGESTMITRRKKIVDIILVICNFSTAGKLFVFIEFSFSVKTVAKPFCKIRNFLCLTRSCENALNVSRKINVQFHFTILVFPSLYTQQ